jgi:hypothetical protein
MSAVIAILTQLFAAIGSTLADGSHPLSTMVMAGLLGAAAVAVAIAIVHTATVLLGWFVGTGIARPEEDADLPVLVSYADPDADGHVRSRAPGLAA